MKPFKDMHASARPSSVIPSRRSPAFTLVELLVSMTVLVVLMTLVTQVVGQVQKTWLSSNTRVAQFREARTAFDLITHNLSQATLNPYWDTDTGGLSEDANRQSQIPTKYVRKSDLQFVTGRASNLVQAAPNRDQAHLPFFAVFFQATLGVTQTPDYERMQNLLCGRGYFIQYGDDRAFRPPFVTRDTNRFRLMEYSPTAEQNQIYYDALNHLPVSRWYQDAGAAVDQNAEANASGGGTSTAVVRGFTRPVAENIVALIIAPRVSNQQAQSSGKEAHWIANDFNYDSTQVANTSGSSSNTQGTQHLLPPLVDVIMIAIDEASQDSFTTDDVTQLQGVFSSAGNLDTSLTTAQGVLINRAPPKKPVNFRIFKTTVEIRAARWSL